MAVVNIAVPQMGEGLREVLILRLLKQPGDRVRRDEAMYAMETDKADMDVESPWAGILEEWLVSEGDVVAVGAPVARMRIEGTAPGSAPGPPSPAAALRASRPAAAEATPPAAQPDGGRRPVLIPPRTRAYLRAMGISAAEAERIPASGGSLTPQDVDRFVAAAAPPAAAQAEPGASPSKPETDYEEFPLPAQQRVLNFRLQRSSSQVVPATMSRRLLWARFRQAVEALRRRHRDTACAEFEVFAFAVARAARQHEKFRSMLAGKNTLRRYRRVNLGIAVQRPNDDLVTAVVDSADCLDFPTFVATVQERVARALEGEDQAASAVQVLLSFVSAYEITDATPVLVAPAAAVVFLGAPHGPPGAESATLGVTFDHRLIQGVGAARFLHEIADQVEALASPEDAAEAHQAEEGGDARADTAAARRGAAGEPSRGLESLLAEEVGRRLGLTPAQIDPEVPLRNLGLNSRLALDLTRRLAELLGLDLPATLVWAYPTIEKLAAHLSGRDAAQASGAGIQAFRPVRPPTGGATSLLQEIDQLSEEEAAARAAGRMEPSR